MSDPYPKRLSLRGIAELTYRDYGTRTESGGNSSDGGRTDFEQKYSLIVKGIVYDPRLITYSGRVTLRDNDSEGKFDLRDVSSSRDINYNLSADFLPYRPISLSIYASKTDATAQVSNAEPYDASSRFYGATLRITHRALPIVRIKYNHWDYSTNRRLVGTENNQFEVDVRGNLKAIKTRYLLRYVSSEYSSAVRSYNSYHLRGFSDTLIKKEHILRNTLHYSDLDLSKFASVKTELEVYPFKRFSHVYSYQYDHIESLKFDSSSYKTAARWVNRLSDNLTARASVGYGTTKSENNDEDEKDNFYTLGAGVKYWKRINGYDLRSNYSFLIARKRETTMGDRLDRKISYHSLGLGFLTRKLRPFKLYGDYDFYLLNADVEDSTVHIVRTGVTGRGPKRAYWTLEGFFQWVDRSISDPAADLGGAFLPHFEEGDSQDVRVEIRYPLSFNGLSVSVNGGYKFLQTENNGNTEAYYTASLRYRLLRNLLLLARGKVIRYEFEEAFRDKETRDLSLDLRYWIGRTFLNFELGHFREEDDFGLSETRRIILTLRRIF